MLPYIIIISFILLVIFGGIGAKSENIFFLICMVICFVILVFSCVYCGINNPNFSKRQQLAEYDKCILYKKAIADTNNLISLQCLNGMKDDIDKMNKDIEDSRKNDNILLRFFYDKNTKYLEEIEIDSIKCKLIR